MSLDTAATVQAVATVVLVCATLVYAWSARRTQRVMERALVSERESDVAPAKLAVGHGGQEGNKPIALVTLKNLGCSVASRVETGAWIVNSPPSTVIPWFASQVITLSPGEEGIVSFAFEDPETYGREHQASRGRWRFEVCLYIDWRDPLRGLMTRDAVFVWDGTYKCFHARYISKVSGSVLTEHSRNRRVVDRLGGVLRRRGKRREQEGGPPKRPTSEHWSSVDRRRRSL